MTIKNNEDAVSPVIGVILMVAIVVILAAIIAAFVFGMVGTVEGTKVVGLTAGTDGSNNATVTWQGGADLGAINNVTATFDGKIAEEIYKNDQKLERPTGTPSVGDRWYFQHENEVAGKRFVLVGIFADGTEQILIDRSF